MVGISFPELLENRQRTLLGLRPIMAAPPSTMLSAADFLPWYMVEFMNW